MNALLHRLDCRQTIQIALAFQLVRPQCNDIRFSEYSLTAEKNARAAPIHVSSGSIATGSQKRVSKAAHFWIFDFNLYRLGCVKHCLSINLVLETRGTLNLDCNKSINRVKVQNEISLAPILAFLRRCWSTGPALVCFVRNWSSSPLAIYLVHKDRRASIYFSVAVGWG